MRAKDDKACKFLANIGEGTSRLEGPLSEGSQYMFDRFQAEADTPGQEPLRASLPQVRELFLTPVP